MDKLFANSGDPDQMPHSAASDHSLPCLSVTLLGVSPLQWVKELIFSRGVGAWGGKQLCQTFTYSFFFRVDLFS